MLPVPLELISVSQNYLSGPVNLKTLPPNPSQLYLFKNSFSGEADFTKLPQTLKSLYISDTQVSGEIFIEGKKDFYFHRSNIECHWMEDSHE
mmetsp:Transcript_23919/g.37256  ORF Transcript_23919/g.37256 Transcript_23919/m.37256 type:complete len:92 (-) Transcript_23919:24-299(-)